MLQGATPRTPRAPGPAYVGETLALIEFAHGYRAGEKDLVQGATTVKFDVLGQNLEKGLASGHDNAHCVALIQQILANNGHAPGHRFFKESTGDRVFDVRAGGVDHVLNFDVNFGLGDALASSAMPVGPRSCYWGGYGGSFVIIDQDLELTVVYMMNRMRMGLVGTTRGPIIAPNAMAAALS